MEHEGWLAHCTIQSEDVCQCEEQISACCNHDCICIGPKQFYAWPEGCMLITHKGAAVSC